MKCEYQGGNDRPKSCHETTLKFAWCTFELPELHCKGSTMVQLLELKEQNVAKVETVKGNLVCFFSPVNKWADFFPFNIRCMCVYNL